MKLLLFGSSGQLGNDLRIRAEALHFDFFASVQNEIDITNRDQVFNLVRKIQPEVIVNAAAYTNVDLAETQQAECFAVNRDAVGIISLAAKEVGAKLCHISTDYVFDGTSQRPLKESDSTNPINVYGRSKLEGEKAALDILGERALVLRTAWLHGSRGKNFVQTMLRLFKEQKQIKVVNDQWGSPTWTGWLAESIMDLVRMDCGGVMHAVGSGIASWFEVSQFILETVNKNLDEEFEVELLTQTTEECARPAQRPRYSALDTSLIAKTLGREPQPWREGIRSHLKELGYNVE
jgi:dTDP-4-dehydrorhamnose reductase